MLAVRVFSDRCVSSRADSVHVFFQSPPLTQSQSPSQGVAQAVATVEIETFPEDDLPLERVLKTLAAVFVAVSAEERRGAVISDAWCWLLCVYIGLVFVVVCYLFGYVASCL